MNINIATQKFYSKIITGLLILLGQTFSSSAAIPKANAFEVVTAFTTMALDIAQKHYEFKDDSRKAEVLGLLAATSSVTNKSLFFYNNHEAKRGLGAWDPATKDCVVNGLWGARDLVTLAKKLALVSTRSMVAGPITQSELPTLLEGLEIPQDATAFILPQEPAEETPSTSDKKSKFMYARDVIIFPVLKGLSSLAVACTQNYATSYSGDRARVTATAAYSFVRLLEEYSNLAPDSKLSKPLIAAALVNLLWLGYEAQEYERESNIIRGRKRQGECNQCHDGREQSLRVLACGHARCKNCLRATVQYHHQRREGQMHHIECLEAGCNHELTRNEVRGIAHNNPQIMRGYDMAAFHNAPLISLRLVVPPIVPPGPVPPIVPPAPVRPPRPAFVAIDPAARAAFAAHAHQGNCVVCMEDDADLRRLGCNHEYCVGCLQGHIQARFADEAMNLDQLACPTPGCGHHLDRNEIGCIAAADRERVLLDAYDNAAYDRANPAEVVHPPADAEELAAIARGELQICPGCNYRTHRDDGCNHMTCPCGVEYCYVCGTRYNPLIAGGHGWGARACACPHFPGGAPEPIPVAPPAADPFAPHIPPAPVDRLRFPDGTFVDLDFDPGVDMFW